MSSLKIYLISPSVSSHLFMYHTARTSLTDDIDMVVKFKEHDSRLNSWAWMYVIIPKVRHTKNPRWFCFIYDCCHSPFTVAVLLQLYSMASSPNAVPGRMSPSNFPFWITSSKPTAVWKTQHIVQIHFIIYIRLHVYFWYENISFFCLIVILVTSRPMWPLFFVQPTQYFFDLCKLGSVCLSHTILTCHVYTVRINGCCDNVSYYPWGKINELKVESELLKDKWKSTFFKKLFAFVTKWVDV